MYPNYVARKSFVAHISIWLILLSLITYGISLIFLVFRLIGALNYSIEFYNDRITTKKGILARSEYSTLFMGVYSVSVRQSLFGRLFNYGDVYVDCVGKWDVSTKKIHDPYALKAYLETCTAMTAPMNRTHVFFD